MVIGRCVVRVPDSVRINSSHVHEFWCTLKVIQEKWLLASSYLCVLSSVRMEQRGSHWTHFYEILYFSTFRKSVKKIQFSLKSDKNNGYFTWRLTYSMVISSRILLRMIDVSDRHCRENQNTLFTFYIYIFFKSYLLWDNMEKYGTAGQATDENTIQHMRISYWITKATDTHWEYVLLIAFPRQQWLRERASILRLYVTLPVLLCN
jgi:hypothetical protein